MSGLGNSIANKQERRGLRNKRDTGWMIVGAEWFGKRIMSKNRHGF